MMQDSDDQNFLPPDQLFVDEPTGIRAVAIERYASMMNKLFESKREEFVTAFMQKQRISRIDAYPRVLNQFQQFQKMYRDEVAALSNPLGAILSRARDEEDVNNTNKAVQLYEELADNGFLGSMPYERLRIIYTKQGSFDEALRICKRYIEVMKRVQKYWPGYANITTVSEFQVHIKKLSKRLKK